MKKEIKDLSAKYFSEVVAMRRKLHENPELSFAEKETAKFVSSILKKNKIKHTKNWAGYGIVAEIKGKKPSKKVIALRGDMDALPINEKNNVSYKSKNVGVMHACGHDVHTSSLLGTALILNDLKEHFGGTIKFIFQPGEEKLPGGASIMIKEGVLKNPAPELILGQHVHPPLEVGKIGICAGKYMASADELYFVVKGKGGHGALPHNCIDPIAISAQLITGLQQIVSRYGNPNIPSVLTFGKIFSDGGATNIIPNSVNIHGTFRTMDEKWRKKAHGLIKKQAKGIAKTFGGDCEVDIRVGYPCLYNNEDLTGFVRKAAIEYIGAKNVVELPQRMSSEDFAFYSQKIPACFYRLGTGNKRKGIVSPVHTDTFNIDEQALLLSTGMMAFLSLKTLSS